MAWAQIPITGSFVGLNGESVAGRSIVFSTTAVPSADGQVVGKRVYAAILDNTGSIPAGFTLPATNDPTIDPRGWAYTVDERFIGGRDPYLIYVPYTSPGVNLASVTPVEGVDFVLLQEQNQSYADAVSEAAATSVRSDLGSVAAGNGGAMVGFLQSGAGAVARTMQDKARDVLNAKDFGALGNGISSNAATSFNAAVTAAIARGGATIRVPSGSYLLQNASASAVVIDAPNVAEPGTAVAIIGDGAASSILISGTAGQYALELIGGTATDSHGYEVHRDFSVMAGTPGTNGIKIFNKAFTGLENVTLQGHNTGLRLESVLSSKFTNVTCMNNAVYGAQVLKGAGFSGINANTFDSCNFESNVSMGFLGQANMVDCTFINCNFENNGRFGQPSEGGAALVFDGGEGGVGATFVGGYFESNRGGADLFLTNTGSNYVTVVLIGVSFNRNVAATYTTNCIQTSGKIRLITIGCAFRSYNGYVPDVSRKYIAGDAALVWEDYGSVMQDAVEKPAAFSMSDRVSFSGSVSSAGASLKLPPGWSCSKLATGSYRVIHNLGVASINDYSVSLVASNAGPVFPLSMAKSVNSFDVSMVNPSFASTDAQFDFTLTRG